MVLDDELVKKAKAAGAQLIEAMKQAEIAQAEYHTIIRRAHLAGGSLREIAQALGMSHQRVQQIVQSAGGTWWSRVWSSRHMKRDIICTFCGRPPSEVSKLLAGPNVYICDSCLQQANKTLRGTAQVAAFAVASRRSSSKCSFCGKRGPDRQVVTTAEANICNECLGICQQIIDERTRSIDVQE